ncbi:hypothetical protein [Acidianus bottle-shaped virus]|uniref:Uncharacterized protein ORF257 n=1 Tax=Acidianus bottle-shaped virus (isolate Italy/Pozzuoli) TaxID=654911 RepID=Y257_ABVP|nr:hypothetical protein ABV_gp24 [Acidianus bottle-shaped virus]A4ZUB0.1 RecName: Full=Uncharacterized protein ORF257 [Acidianus bottle-shaped virus (isolate Pozzuoli)]ABP73414.1 hypothetical protein [Acidianus bottle-shaped virus]
MGEQVLDFRGLFDERGNPITKRKKAVEQVEEVVTPEEKTKVVTVEKPVYIPVEKRKLKRKITFAPEDSLSTDDVFAPRVYYDYNFSPFDFLSRSRTFAPRMSYDYEYAPEDFSSYSEVYSPSESYDDTFAPKYRNFRKSVYSPSTVIKNKFAPKVTQRIKFKPRLFDKLLAIFAPESILKTKENVKYKPYNYQYQETAIIDTYNPEQITTVEKFSPKDESNFNLRIAPETDFSIKLSPPPISFTSVDYYGILKKIIR